MKRVEFYYDLVSPYSYLAYGHRLTYPSRLGWT
jgi:2-hydroxychromene-2-carboxylate isomerase